MKQRKNYKVLGKLPHGLYLIRSAHPRSKKLNFLTEDGKLVSKRRWFTRVVVEEHCDEYYCGFDDKCWIVNSNGIVSRSVEVHDNHISPIVEYINNNIDTNDVYICHLLTLYLHSSYRYQKQNIDGSWLNVQPGWPGYTVTNYFVYEDKDMAFAHKTKQMVLTLDGHYTTEISFYKFKRFAKKIDYFNRRKYYEARND